MSPPEILFVQLILPIRNEARQIARTIAAVMNQDYPAASYELLVIDGDSSDGTREELAKLTAVHMGRLRIFDNPNRIFSSGFNIGLRHADADVVIMLGGHVEIACDYISQCVNVLKSGGYDCVGGVIETVSHTGQGRAIAAAMSSRFGVGNVAFRTGSDGEREVDTVAFGAYRLDVFTRFGTIDEAMVKNQDDEFNYRIRKGGARIGISPAIRAVYYGRASFRTLLSQYFLYGKWKVAVWRRHPGQMRIRHFVPMLFIIGLIVMTIASVFIPALSWALPLYAGVYVIAAMAAAWATRKDAGLAHVPLVLAAFIVLHVSYGSGFLVGLLSPVPPPRYTI